MSAWLPEVEGWVKVLAAAVAAFAAAAVPVRSWINEERKYRAQTLEAMADAAKAAVAGASAPAPAGGSMLGDVVASEGLIHAVRDVAKAIREGTQAEKAKEADRIAKAIEELVENERREREKPAGGRR